MHVFNTIPGVMAICFIAILAFAAFTIYGKRRSGNTEDQDTANQKPAEPKPTESWSGDNLSPDSKVVWNDRGLYGGLVTPIDESPFTPTPDSEDKDNTDEEIAEKLNPYHNAFDPNKQVGKDDSNTKSDVVNLGTVSYPSSLPDEQLTEAVQAWEEEIDEVGSLAPRSPISEDATIRVNVNQEEPSKYRLPEAEWNERHRVVSVTVDENATTRSAPDSSSAPQEYASNSSSSSD